MKNGGLRNSIMSQILIIMYRCLSIEEGEERRLRLKLVLFFIFTLGLDSSHHKDLFCSFAAIQVSKCDTIIVCVSSRSGQFHLDWRVPSKQGPMPAS